MNKRGFFPALVLLALWGGTIAAARSPASGLRKAQDQEERPKFYVRRVVFEQNVKNSREALGEPDDRCAEIAVGGQLILLMENRIYPSTNFDDGLVVCKQEASYGLEGWFLVSGTQKDPQFAWMPLVRGRSPGSFRLAAMDAAEGSSGVNMIRISNDDTKPILLDALVGYGRMER